MDYSTVTETTGDQIKREALEMLCTRYAFAANFCQGKDVLEVACGSGQGLGYLAKCAAMVVGGDYTVSLVEGAHRYYGGQIPVLCIDAHKLPFADCSFDVVILYEAIYYLSQPDNFLEECKRVLRENGTVLICTVNKDWSDFNPSPLSARYYSAAELGALLDKHNFQVELYGAFPAAIKSKSDAFISYAKRGAIALQLMPKTMKGKALLKRVFYGKLVTVPPAIEEGMANVHTLVPISRDGQNSQYKVLYAVACSIGQPRIPGRVEN
jgi:ubiquinone/menaquinone biosynthesis C-methylase UbiE